MAEIFDWESYVNYYQDLKHAGINNYHDALYHWEQYGKQEGRKMFLINEKCIKSNTFINNNFDILQDTQSNIIISLTTFPARLINPDFDKMIDNLYNQVLKPKYIIINICINYKRQLDKIPIKNNLDILKSKFTNLIINYSEDYGPITKIFGLLKLKNIITNDDNIIFVNDDNLYHKNMTLIYELCFQLYHCEIIFIPDQSNNNYNNIIFYDNFQDYIDISLTFALKYKNIDSLFTFYQNNMIIDNNIWKYYNCLIYLFYKTKKIYTCAINYRLHLNEQLEISKIDPFKQIVNQSMEKMSLEKFLFIYDIFSNLYNNTNKNESIIIFPKFVNKRYLLFNTNNITYVPDDNNYHKMHIDIKYIDKNHIILTTTQYEDIQYDNITVILKVNENKVYKLFFPHNHFSRRESFILFFEENISRIEHINHDFSIIQTNKSEKISLNRFFSIVSILNYIPNLEYKLFNNYDIVEYLKNIDESLLNSLLKLIPGAYKADFFRYIYLYYHGGVYFDCKIILLNGIEDLLLKNNFTADRYENYIYNALMIVTEKMYILLKNIIVDCLDNIVKENYTNDPLEITGPILCGKYIKDNILMQMQGCNPDDIHIIIRENNKIICKCTSLNYYNESYISYGALWHQKYVFNDITLDSQIRFGKD